MIDFVVTYVDGNDPVWREKMLRCRGDLTGEKSHDELIRDERFRDFGVFRYWFRAVAENAPWVHKIYVVTDNQTPEWLNTDDEKIVPVNHTDFIPEKYLPLFNSCAIEVNFHRIPGLSDTFVYFNDDMYLNKSVKEEDFFENGLPKYYAGLEQFEEKTLYSYDYHKFAGMTVANRNVPPDDICITYKTKLFDRVLGEGAWRNFLMSRVFGKFRVTHFEDDHLASPILRTTMEEIWEKEPELLDITSSNRFRDFTGVNQYVFRYYDCTRGNFIPRAKWHGFYNPGAEWAKGWEADIREGYNRCICLNDGCVIPEEFADIKQRMIDAFEFRYPNKCRFEK